MDWIMDNWQVVLLVASVLANAVVATKLQSVKAFLLTVIKASEDKKISDREKVDIYDGFMVMAKDLLKIVKGLTPWK